MKLNRMNDFIKEEKMTFDENQVKSLLEKVESLKSKWKDRIVILKWSDLQSCFSKKEICIFDKLKKIDPSGFGFKGPFLSHEADPSGLVKISGQKYIFEGEEKEIAPQYLSKDVYGALNKMNNAIVNDIDRKLLVDSGYRSSAYQAIVFLWYLDFFKYDLRKTFGRVALPGYSEHGCLKRQAIDFLTIDGKPSENNPYDFVETIEYKWLKKRAKDFGFAESYPKDNVWGVVYEPWHWSFSK